MPQRRVNPFPNNPFLTTLKKEIFENIVGKGENAGNQHFLLFLQNILLCERILVHWHLSRVCCLFMLSVLKSIMFSVWDEISHVVDYYILVATRKVKVRVNFT